jgi:hypothetical protein
MATCAVCVNDALYVYKVTDNFGINYCQYHVPGFLAKNPHLLDSPEVAEPVVTPTTKKKTVASVETDATNS